MTADALLAFREFRRERELNIRKLKATKYELPERLLL